MHISLLKLFPLILFFVLLPIFSSQILDLSEINKENENQYYNDSILDEMPNFEDEDPAPNEDINPSKEPDSDEDEEDDADDRSIMKEWEEYMRDFVPADMLTYEIEGNKKEVIFLQ